jgi:hypothetical protein
VLFLLGYQSGAKSAKRTKSFHCVAIDLVSELDRCSPGVTTNARHICKRWKS